MIESYLIAVDSGTTGTKCAIFNNEGQIIAKAFEQSKLYYPKPNWVEQNPDEMYQSAINTIREATQKAHINKSKIRAICFDGQMAGICGIDKNWNPVMPYDSWLDGRCKLYTDLMRRRGEELIIEKTGTPPTTFSHGPKILWWKNERPEIFKNIFKFIVPTGYIAGKMAGLKGKDAFIDYTYLNFTGYSDLKKATWSPQLCDLFEVPIGKFPKIVKPWEVIGELIAKSADECGLVKGIPIVAGAGDHPAGALGAGIIEPHMVFDIAGTASVISNCVDTYVPDIKQKTLMYIKSVIPGLWHFVGYINGGGLCLQWFRDEFAKEEIARAKQEGIDAFNILDELAVEVPAGSDSMIFIPHLRGRVCPNNADIRGTWLGFSWSHKKSHFYRSILESVAYDYYYLLLMQEELLGNIKFKEARVIGGGAKSQLWNQIKSDVLNLPYVQVNQEETALLGSAIIGGYGVGIFNDISKTVRRLTKPVARIIPRLDYHEYYKNYAEFYKNLLETLEGNFSTLTKLSNIPKPTNKIKFIRRNL